jgi:hypothetical protein
MLRNSMKEPVPKFRPEQQKSPDDRYRHELIQKEFRSILEASDYVLPEKTDAVMVLAAPPTQTGPTANYAQEDNPENVARIRLAIEVCKKVAAKKLNKDLEQINKEDFRSGVMPLLVLNAESERLAMMKKISVEEFHFPPEMVRELNCGPVGIANTKTQFEVFNGDPEFSKFSHVTLITNAYHSPRAARTASMNLPPNIGFDVIGVPLKDFKSNVLRKVLGEIKRILSYTEKGDIAKYSRENDTTKESADSKNK